MASLLSTHLEQISLCAASIAELPFPGPKMFTNALLSVGAGDITSLIRDTEQHERALFHLAPPPLPPTTKFGAAAGVDFAGSTSASSNARRKTQYAGGAAGSRQPKNKAVAAVLGGDLYTRTRNPEQNAGRQVPKGGELDVELLLKGAEKLAAVYPIPGASDTITALRRRHQQLEANIAHYEARVAEQTRELMEMSRPKDRNGYQDDEEDAATKAIPLIREDLEKEEEEVRELERKKKGLEERVEGMERDLGGLMR